MTRIAQRSTAGMAPQPDFVLIPPWNLKEKVIQQLSHIRDWGGRFIVPIPEVTVH